MVQIGDMTIQDESLQLPIPAVVNLVRVLSAGDGTVAYTGFGFKPTKLTMIASKQGDPQVGCIGFSNGQNASSDLAMGNNAKDGTGQWSYPEYIVQLLTSVGNIARAKVLSMDSDGFTLNWVVQAGSPIGTADLRVMAEK